jgi:hypothetical protein
VAHKVPRRARVLPHAGQLCQALAAARPLVHRRSALAPGAALQQEVDGVALARPARRLLPGLVRAQQLALRLELCQLLAQGGALDVLGVCVAQVVDGGQLYLPKVVAQKRWTSSAVVQQPPGRDALASCTALVLLLAHESSRIVPPLPKYATPVLDITVVYTTMERRKRQNIF